MRWPKKVLVREVGPRDGLQNEKILVSAASSEFSVENTRIDENAILYFTSGTTGYPKMTAHTNSSKDFQ